MTGTDLINEALLLLKRITPGQSSSNDEFLTSQFTLNNLIDEWNGEGMTVFSTAPITIALTGAASYTVTPRPVKVEAWRVETSSGQANGGIPLSALEYAAVALDASATGSRCKALNYDA